MGIFAGEKKVSKKTTVPKKTTGSLGNPLKGILGGNEKQVSKQTTVPWAGAQPYLKYGMNEAKKLYNSGSGFKAYSGPMVAPFSSQTKSALNALWNQSQGANPLANPAIKSVLGILGGDINQKFNNLYSDIGTKYSNLGDIIGSTYDKLYSQADNPHWAKAVQDQSDQISNDVQRQYSGLGRTGSGADTGALVDAIGRYRTGALSEHWDQNIANMRGILGDQTQGRLSALGGWTQGRLGTLGAQQQGQLGAIAAAPGAYDLRFAPGRMRAQVGNAYDQQHQNVIDAKMRKFDINQQANWNRLNAYNTSIGAGNPAGTGTQTAYQPTNPLGGILGGALGGGSMFGIPGAVGGGIIGYLSGL